MYHLESIFYSDLINCNSHPELKESCVKFIKEINIDYFMFAVCTPTSFSAPKIETITNYPQEWMNNYFSSELQKNDPVVNYCLENNTPIHWDNLMAENKQGSENQEDVLSMAANVGLVNGYSIPFHSPKGHMAVFSIANTSQKQLELNYASVHSFSTRLFDAYIRIESGNQLIAKLTSREAECLFWACEGKTTWEISQIIGISERTVVFHLSCSTKKLGASNRQHAVAKAITFGLIKPFV